MAGAGYAGTLKMYENGYSLNWQVIAVWLAIAATGGGLLALVERKILQKRLLIVWTIFPAGFVVPMSIYAFAVYDWLVPVLALPILLMMLGGPWAAAVMAGFEIVSRFRRGARL